MKKSASAPPVIVRFLNSCSEDPSGSGDEGLADGRAATAEDAAGDGASRVAPPVDPAAATAPAAAATAAATDGQPVPPPRKNSVRSRADGLRDALQDLSPVKEFVSRLGKSRSTSLDGPGMAAAAAAAAAADRPAEHKTTSDSDKWSRLTEFTEKFTKTVEGKISDYRGSVRSASGAGSGGSASHSDTEVLTESDVLEAVREASPSPPPGEAPPGSPTPYATSDSLDVAFVNVPNPVAAPAASPSRRDFRLASMRPQIFERLQRSVGRPAAPPPPPPSGGSQSPPPAAPSDSVTLSALQGKYIDEEGVDIAEEAVEVPPPPSPPPAERAAQRTYSRSVSDEGSIGPAAGERLVVEGVNAVERTRPAVDLCDWVAVGVADRWRWLAVVVAVLVAAPLPGFVSGLLVGAVLAAAAAAALMPLLRPPPRPLPPPPTLTGRRPPVKEYRPTLMHKDWMHELMASPYDPAAHQPSEARFVRLEGSMLRVSHPKGYVSKRATCDEHIPNLTFVEQRIYDITGCTVELQPEALHATRRWNRRYPLCVRLNNCRRVTRSRGLFGVGQKKATAAADRGRTSDGEWEPDSQDSRSDGASAVDGQRAIYLFARTDRNKEHWFRLLQEATRQGQQEEAPPSTAPESPAAESTSNASATTTNSSSNTVTTATDTATATTTVTTTDTATTARTDTNTTTTADADSGSGAAGGQEETEDGAASQPSSPPQPSPKLDFDYYMSKLIAMTPEGGSDSRPPSPTEGPSRAPPATGHVIWFNALIGRLAFDLFGNRQWAAFVQNRVQRKISRIKPPFFIEELTVTSCDLGSVLPRITSVSAPSCDERGLWTDMTVLYEGGACITLMTKVNLMKLRKKDEQQQLTTEGGTDKEPASGSAEAADAKPADKPCATYALDRNDDLAEMDSSSDEETDTLSACSDGSSPPQPAPSASPSASSTSNQPSSGSSVGKRLLKVVDKVTTSRYFQQATQNRYVKRYMEEFSNTPLELTVTLRHLQGVVTINIPRPHSDRVWYGFRGQPDIVLSAQPRLGTRDVSFTQVTDWIENKLLAEMHKLLVLPNMDDLIVPLLAGEIFDSSDDVSGAD